MGLKYFFQLSQHKKKNLSSEKKKKLDHFLKSLTYSDWAFSASKSQTRFFTAFSSSLRLRVIWLEFEMLSDLSHQGVTLFLKLAETVG